MEALVGMWLFCFVFVDRSIGVSVSLEDLSQMIYSASAWQSRRAGKIYLHAQAKDGGAVGQ